MRTIHKYPLWRSEAEATDRCAVTMPADAVILAVACQRDVPTLWCEVSTDAPMSGRTFEVFGTGHEIPDDAHRVWVGTCFAHGGALVWHVYEVL